MATLTFDGSGDFVRWTPLSATLGDLSNGDGTIAVIARRGGGASGDDVVGLLNSAHNVWYHSLAAENTSQKFFDDDAVAIRSTSSAWPSTTQSADNFRIVVVAWHAGVVERFSWSAIFSAAESWSHEDSIANCPADKAGPGTTGHLMFGDIDDFGNFNGDLALVGIWKGVKMSDAEVEELWTNKKTSDWYNHSVGHPTFLVECTTTSLVDIGAAPSTLDNVTGAVATGPDPTGWTFDGQGTTWQPETNADETARLVRSTLHLT